MSDEQQSPFPQVPGTTEPEFAVHLEQIKSLGVDMKLFERGIWKAQEDCSREAAMTLAQGIIPVNLLGHLERLSRLAKVAAAQRKADEGNIVEAGPGIRISRRPCPDETPPPAPGDASMT